MDWTPWIGRQRPVEEDALRILLVLHQLGEPIAEEDSASPTAASRIVGEGRLQRLDHLVRHPVALAFTLMVVADRPSGTLAGVVRQLLPPEERLHRVGSGRLHRFHPGSWERWDDVWAYLGCRNLVQVLPTSKGHDLSYQLTIRGAAHIEGLYASERSLAPLLDRCRILKKHLPATHRSSGDAPRDIDLAAVDRRIDDFQRQQQVALDDDLLPRLFQTTFGEPL